MSAGRKIAGSRCDNTCGAIAIVIVGNRGRSQWYNEMLIRRTQSTRRGWSRMGNVGLFNKMLLLSQFRGAFLSHSFA